MIYNPSVEFIFTKIRNEVSINFKCSVLLSVLLKMQEPPGFWSGFHESNIKTFFDQMWLIFRENRFRNLKSKYKFVCTLGGRD